MMLSGERTGFSPIRSIQGDILRICDTSGNTVAEYTYDAWGGIIDIKDGSGNDVSGNANHIANINPFRYRGYYYDTETGFYYLQTRYYDPEVGRFLNADCYIGANGDIPGYNSFAYCSNAPLRYSDKTGSMYESDWIWEMLLYGSSFGTSGSPINKNTSEQFEYRSKYDNGYDKATKSNVVGGAPKYSSSNSNNSQAKNPRISLKNLKGGKATSKKSNNMRGALNTVYVLF